MKIVWIKHTTTIYDHVRLAALHNQRLVAIFEETKTENHQVPSDIIFMTEFSIL
jgi:hypothetical protein